jgi:transposase
MNTLGERISEGKKPGSVAMKRKVHRLYKEGFRPQEIATKLGISKSTIKVWIVPLEKHSTGFSQRPYGQAAARVGRLTGRKGEDIRQEMESKGNDPCVFCGSAITETQGWSGPAFHHYDDGSVDRAHKGCNAVRRHTG